MLNKLDRPNILIILLDGVRPDRIRNNPDFATIKSKGIFCNNMFTTSPYTLASLHSLFTGCYGSTNGVNGYYKINGLRPSIRTLAEYLSDSGYITWADPMREELCPNKGFARFQASTENKYDLLSRHKKIIEELSEIKKNNPYFLFLHCSSIHTDYIDNVFNVYDDFSEEYFSNVERNSKNYDSYLAKALDYSNKIYEFIESKGLLKDTLTIFLSDHGMGIGEKIGERAYGVFTYDYSIKIFSHFIFPKLFSPGSENTTLSEHIDIMPTILELLNINLSDSNSSIDGKSILSDLIDNRKKSLFSFLRKKPEKFIYSETGGLNGPWPSPDSPNVRCIRSDQWKLIHNLTPDTWELYDITNDPDEINDLSELNFRTLDKMKGEFKRKTSKFTHVP